MQKTLAQRITEMTTRIREMTALRDTGMACQHELDRAREERDRLHAKQRVVGDK